MTNAAFWQRVYRTMQREMLCSEHAAICFMAAQDKNRGRKHSTASTASTASAPHQPDSGEKA